MSPNWPIAPPASTPLAEEEQMPVPRLIHRFEDRVVLLAHRAVRHALPLLFPQAGVGPTARSSPILSESELAAAAHYLAGTPGNSRSIDLRRRPADAPVPPVETAGRNHRRASFDRSDPHRAAGCRWSGRKGSRPELSAFLGEIPGLWFATHFNHPREVTPEAAAACGRLIRAGVPVVNPERAAPRRQ